MMIETTNHDWIRILILDVMSNLIDKVENENSNYNIKCQLIGGRSVNLSTSTEVQPFS